VGEIGAHALLLFMKEKCRTPPTFLNLAALYGQSNKTPELGKFSYKTRILILVCMLGAYSTLVGGVGK
jgi:hypothetical protein